MPPLRVGLVGYGGFGRFLRHTWSVMPGVAVSVVATLDAHATPDGAVVVSDWRDVVGRPDIDLIAVATPPSTHAEIGRAALAAGHHLLVEKPVATTRAEADRLIAARDASGRVAAVDFQLRFNPVVEALVAWGASGAFGPLVRVAVENEAQDATLPAGHWFWDRAQSGGILVEHAVHFLDLVNAIVAASGGDPAAATATGAARRRADGREDRVLATVVHRDGPLATHAHAFTRPGTFERTTLRLSFALADVDVDGWIPLSGTVRALVAPAAEDDLRRLPGWQETSRVPVADGRVRVGDTLAPAAWQVEGRFAIAHSKAEAYADAARRVLHDVRRAIADPAHRLRTPLEAGRDALAQALAARASADSRVDGSDREPASPRTPSCF